MRSRELIIRDSPLRKRNGAARHTRSGGAKGERLPHSRLRVRRGFGARTVGPHRPDRVQIIAESRHAPVLVEPLQELGVPHDGVRIGQERTMLHQTRMW